MSKNADPQCVAIDTMVLVWAIRSDADSEMSNRSKWLLATLQDDEAQIIVPPIVLAEFLVPIADLEARREMMSVISRRFVVPAFDVLCAPVSAALFSDGKRLRNLGKPTGEKDRRHVLKSDAMIIACAKVAGAHAFYSHDRYARELAQHAGLQSFDLPTVAPTLFDAVPGRR